MIKAGFVEDMLRDMESGVWDYTHEGKCSQCGSCCSDLLPVGKHELKRIRDYVKKNQIKPQKHFAPLAVAPMFEMVCPFRNNSAKRCEIYPVRPAICRDFQCDKPRKHIQANSDMYEKKFSIVSMRETFFGKE